MITHAFVGPTRNAIAAFCVAAALLGASGAFAGECPKDQILAPPLEIEETPDIGVRRKPLSFAKL